MTHRVATSPLSPPRLLIPVLLGFLQAFESGVGGGGPARASVKRRLGGWKRMGHWRELLIMKKQDCFSHMVCFGFRFLGQAEVDTKDEKNRSSGCLFVKAPGCKLVVWQHIH